MYAIDTTCPECQDDDCESITIETPLGAIAWEGWACQQVPSRSVLNVGRGATY